MSDDALPTTLTLDEAFRAAFFLTKQYVALEREPGEGLVLFGQYPQSDPARWEDWQKAVRRAVNADEAIDPLTENLSRDDG
ncbi:hypothetical protein [Lapillicoccus jejuensis]|uniref:Uncharacterized protein n=1 Tax=Lapillicoccus jejuensis TaxID=402171 RepID=A0A542DZF1_9MICO|nr:hypothetical protein [Lapillicoccus jejuensis]TQJ08473.1 hypothetical protein FB458_1563 [Lapillicoccus jejuensis]